MKLKGLFLFLFCSHFLFGQIITVSEPIMLRNDIAYHILGDQQDHVLLLRDKDTNFEVQAYDGNMHLKWEKELELDRGRPNILEVIPDQGHFKILYKYKRRGKIYLKMHRYNSSANLIDSTTIMKLGSSFFNTKYETILSEDRRKMLLVDYDRIEKFKATMIDLDSMKVVWKHEFKSEDFSPIREMKEMVADNNGNAYIIFNRKNRKSTKEDHRLEVFTHGPDYTNTGKIVIPLEDHLTYDASFIIDNLNKKFVFGGLYSEKSIGRANGYFYITGDIPNTTVVTKAFHSFSDEQVSILLDKKVDENKGVSQMEVQELVLRRDGGILLFLERVKLDERSPVGMNDRYGSYLVDYYYDNLFVASIHPDGKKHWEEILHKRQFSQDDGASYSSYFLLKTPQNLRVIFNDDIRNENMVSEYVLSGNGSLDRNSVFNTESQNLRLRFRDAVQVASNEIIVASERKNRIKLVRVRY